MSGDDTDRVASAYAGYEASPGKRRAWDAGNPGNAAIRDELAAAVLGAVDVGRGELLDAGCGPGWWLTRLRLAGVPAERLHGLDLLPDRVRRAAAAVPGAAVQAGDLRALPYEEGRFAAVFLFTVLSSMGSRESVAAAVTEARRVLAPGGALVMWEPRLPNPRNRNTRVVGARDLGPGVESTTLTLLPWLARRLGSRTAALYPRLAAVPVLRTHRLYVARR